MTLTLHFQLTLHSDYHISAGHGHGSEIDSALLRDADGIPVIRGTTLSGLLRDALWRLLSLTPMKDKYPKCSAADRPAGAEDRPGSYCGQSSPTGQGFHCPVCRLFGTPKSPKRWAISSARPLGREQWTSSSRRSTGKRIARNRIDPRQRRAAHRQLFTQENGSSQTRFVFDVFWPESGETLWDDAALLVAAARFVRQMGRGRRRGSGECLLTLTGVSGTQAGHYSQNNVMDWQQWLLQRFKSHWLNGSPSPLLTTKASMVSAIHGQTDKPKPCRLRLILRTDEPLVLSRKAEAGNMFTSVLSIPGTVLRGALAWQAAERFDLEEPAGSTFKAFKQVFLDGGARFADLYPAIYTTGMLIPCMPAPKDLLFCKRGGAAHGIHFASNASAPQHCPMCGSVLHAPGGGHVVLEQWYWASATPIYIPTCASELHPRIDPQTNRAATGQLYGYVGLDGGQYFIGELWFRDATNWTLFKELTSLNEARPCRLRLGRGHRRGYGGVTVWAEPVDTFADTHCPTPLNKRVAADAMELQLTLLSDTIIQDTWGRFAAGFDESWLRKQLELPVEKVICAAAALRDVDGFNDRLGLPRWRDIALCAGSTARLALDKPADLKRLEHLELERIGLRRNEGFGRIAFNHPIYDCCKGIAGGIGLSPEMAPAIADTSMEEIFMQEWNRWIEKKTGVWEGNGEYGSLCRWLVAHRLEDPHELAQTMLKIGNPDSIIEQMTGERNELGVRYKLQPPEKCFCFKEGTVLISNLLNQLKERFPSSFWPKGIERITAVVTANCNNEEG